ncbi:MAG TPA: Ppx/GppA phosphatase family protein [Candidatus Eisenbacteria bacterium]|nr:Ppx/GppA phosphatase family protein [Candidatus Eisenbacteria bacterium]
MDVGSNALRLSIAEFKTPTQYKILERVRMPVRLGESVFHTNRIDPATMEAALDAFRAFRRKMEQHDVVVHRAVATSATREAKNRAAFLERVHAETGLDLELIKGTEEARLVALGVRSRLSLDRGLSMILDVGGGSSEIALVGHGEILIVESHDVGVVRLLERVGSAPPEKMLKLIQATLRSARFPILDFFKRRRLARFVGTGGNIESLATMTTNGSSKGSPRGEDRAPARLTLLRLRKLLGKMARMTPAERAETYGLRPDRADVIVPAGAIFEYVMTRIRARDVWVPFVGLVDGVLIDVARAAGAEGMKSLEVSQTRNAAMAILKKYEADPKHALRVSALAVSLFDQLKPMHGLGKRDRLLMELAGLLHEVGNFVGAAGHHRHAYYIIAQTPILGLSDEELLVVANVARYHRKAPPDLSHEGYRDLAEKDRQRVRVLAAILRVADALDHDHRQSVTAVQAKSRGSELRLKVKTRGDVTLDEWSVGDKGDLFKDEFGLKPVVVARG